MKIDFGVLEFGDDPHVLTGYREKPEYSFQVSMGVYILDPLAWDFLTPGEALTMPELLESMRARGHADPLLPPALLLARHRPPRRLRHGQRDLRGPPGRVPGRARPVDPQDRARPVNSARQRLDSADLLGALAGYLIGAIPFGYLIFRGATGIDIRTVGLGQHRRDQRRPAARLPLLPARLHPRPAQGLRCRRWACPWRCGAWAIGPPADLPVFVALAAILGHNFPVYLGFKGGKGVATSLGALLALDPLACAAAAAGFFARLLRRRGTSRCPRSPAPLAFVAGHFAIVREPWSRENLAMSLLAIAIAVLLIVRHHKNLGRILAGTEPKVPLRRPAKDEPRRIPGRPADWIHPLWLVGLAVRGRPAWRPALWVVRRARAPIEVTAGPWALRETHRELTGQQRSTRVLFTERGRKLAVMCPRYNKVLVYRVTARESLEPAAEIALEGRPVAMAAAGGIAGDPPAPARRRQAPGPGLVGSRRPSTARDAGPASRPATIPTTWPSLPTAASCWSSAPGKPRETRKKPSRSRGLSTWIGIWNRSESGTDRNLESAESGIEPPPDRPPEPGAERRRRPADPLRLGDSRPDHSAQGQASRGDRPDPPEAPRMAGRKN